MKYYIKHTTKLVHTNKVWFVNTNEAFAWACATYKNKVVVVYNSRHQPVITFYI